MLVVIGDLVADLIVLGGATLERGTDNPAEVRLTRGGSAANVAVAAATQHPSRFIGRVGDDTLAVALVAALEAAGVDVQVQRHGRTGSIVVLVDAVGERTMITDRGAAAELDRIDPSWTADADWVHLPLYGFASPLSARAVTDAATRAAAGGARVSLDLSSVAMMRTLGGERLRRLLAELEPDVVFANADEAAAADELGVAPAGVYVVKRGAEPVLVSADGETTAVPVDRVDDVVDSTGAGDAFAAGYIVAALAGADSRESARAGSVLAMSALRRPGAL
ncbi:carbohydrate kinase family protein [Microbacterium trichothecenolyticum]|uniref:2-dehydro-3-deoxygluconokinase n=1 Tax=Microbacterium trichothecenolyticum TaxID=69370 RepID=A0A0M2GZQ3_MICTR|nr:carbohydrate kinase family protein [Microbacterium trichothecenolyticum]KJL39636.1 2-dehydro-3-deoxygluconokinase [Microbacterium trichothecenolyticum]